MPAALKPVVVTLPVLTSLVPPLFAATPAALAAATLPVVIESAPP